MQCPTLNLLCIWTWQDSKPVQSPFPYLIKVIAEQLLEPSKQKHCHQKQTHGPPLREGIIETICVLPLLHNRTDNPQNTIPTGKRNRNALLRTAVQHSCVCISVGECECLVLWLFIFKTKRKLNITAFTTISTSLLYWIVSICKHYSKYTTCLSFSVNIRLVLHWKWEVCTT